jgi:hypothetical protein
LPCYPFGKEKKEKKEKKKKKKRKKGFFYRESDPLWALDKPEKTAHRGFGQGEKAGLPKNTPLPTAIKSGKREISLRSKPPSPLWRGGKGKKEKGKRRKKFFSHCRETLISALALAFNCHPVRAIMASHIFFAYTKEIWYNICKGVLGAGFIKGMIRYKTFIKGIKRYMNLKKGAVNNNRTTRLRIK